MVNDVRAAQGSAAAAGTKFKDMGAGRKVAWVVKFVVFLCSFGFAFPLIMSE
jgi:hypothetical protein